MSLATRLGRMLELGVLDLELEGAGQGRREVERQPGRQEQEDPTSSHPFIVPGFLQMTFRSAWRFSSRTTLSARASASGNAAGSSTFSAWPPEARQTSSSSGAGSRS